jgi:hemoglobin-like flavoprotein
MKISSLSAGNVHMMTEHQRELVRSSFLKIIPIAEETSDLFYSRLFEIAPYIRPIFKGDMKEQGKKMMTMLEYIVQTTERFGENIPSLEKLGKDHRRYGVTSGHYDIFASALLWTLERMLGRDFTDDVRNAWVLLYVDISAVMKKAASNATKAA